MNLKEIREAARIGGLDEVKLAIEPEDIEPFDSWAVAPKMAEAFERLAKVFEVTTGKLTDIMDEMYGKIVAITDRPGVGMRGEGAAVFLEEVRQMFVRFSEEEMRKRICEARSVPMMTTAGGTGLPGEMIVELGAGFLPEGIVEKMESAAVATGSSMASVGEALSRLIDAPMVLEMERAVRASVFSKEKVVKIYALGELVGVSNEIESTCEIMGAIIHKVRFPRLSNHAKMQIATSLRKREMLLACLEDGMGTPHSIWKIPLDEACRYALAEANTQFEFDTRLATT